MKERIGQRGERAPDLVKEATITYVSRTDVGSAPRFAGLGLSDLARSETTVELRYAARAVFDAVRAHHVQGFTAAGYAPEVVKTTPRKVNNTASRPDPVQ